MDGTTAAPGGGACQGCQGPLRRPAEAALVRGACRALSLACHGVARFDGLTLLQTVQWFGLVGAPLAAGGPRPRGRSTRVVPVDVRGGEHFKAPLLDMLRADGGGGTVGDLRDRLRHLLDRALRPPPPPGGAADAATAAANVARDVEALLHDLAGLGDDAPVAPHGLAQHAWELGSRAMDVEVYRRLDAALRERPAPPPLVVFYGGANHAVRIADRLCRGRDDPAWRVVTEDDDR